MCGCSHAVAWHIVARLGMGHEVVGFHILEIIMVTGTKNDNSKNKLNNIIYNNNNHDQQKTNKTGNHDQEIVWSQAF